MLNTNWSNLIYRWTKAVHAHYNQRDDVCGYSLSEIDLITGNGKPFKRPDDLIFMFKRYATFGFSPHPGVWKEFQKWFHHKISDTAFRPYVYEDPIFTTWYKIFEKKHFQNSMWSMWFEYFTHHHNLYALFPNIGSHFHQKKKIMWKNSTFAIHRREKGLHFANSAKKFNSKDYLVSHWHDYYITFPSRIPIYYYNASLVGYVITKQ